eukprot:92146-Rhodomonas_salina.1
MATLLNALAEGGEKGEMIVKAHEWESVLQQGKLLILGLETLSKQHNDASSRLDSSQRRAEELEQQLKEAIQRTDVAYAGTRRSLVETKAWELQQIVEGLSVTALSAEIQELMHSMETRNAELQEENRALEEMCAQHVDTILKAQQFATAAKGQAAKDTTQAETQAPSPTGEEQEPAKEEPGIE